MKIIVFGASGRVGQNVVRELLKKGHAVRVFTHTNNPFKDVESVTGDIHDGDAVGKAIKGCDAVICTLASWHTQTKDIQVSAIQSIIPAMKEQGITRIISVTGSGVFDTGDSPSWFDKTNRQILSIMASKVFRDGEEHITRLRNSGLDWTVIRSPIMNDHGKPGLFRLDTSFPKPWETILRADVARAMVNELESQQWLRTAPFIHRAKS